MFKNTKNIKVLTRKDFKIVNGKVELVNKKLKEGCVMIYANWCPHCVSKEERMSNFAHFIKEKTDIDYNIGVVEGDTPEMKDVKNALGFAGYPTFYDVFCINNKSDVIEMSEATKEIIYNDAWK